MKNSLVDILSVSFLLSLAFSSQQAIANPSDFFEMTFEELLQVKVSVASGIDESIQNAPASLVLISRKDIESRGYQNLYEIIADLPGFDVIEINGFSQIGFYQRGYRTPATTRTLLMINGVVDNHLWNQQVYLSHQYPISNIKHIEVLYGPASAVYGANAFAGVINIVTRQASDLAEGETKIESQVQLASYDSKALDFGLRSHWQDLSYSISGRYFKTDGPELDDFNSQWGYLNNQWLSNADVWGALLNSQQTANQLGEYKSPATEWGVLADLNYKNFKLGLIHWKIDSGYGVYYAADHGQPNANWQHQSTQLISEYHYQLNQQIDLNSQLIYRENRTWGDWAEAYPDWNEGLSNYSYVSYSNWNSISDSLLFKQDFNWKVSDNLQLLTGIKLERKHLTKAYDICGYYADAYCSTQDATNLGELGLGNGVSHSSLNDYQVLPPPLADMPSDNKISTLDKGLFVQAIFDYQKFRIQTGLRFDDNNIYGSVLNPRASLIYHADQTTSYKFLYGEAYQEPSPQLRWGGWNGRNQNPDLKPESVKNLEFIIVKNTLSMLHEISLFSAHYFDVLKEESENAGNRDVSGLEYRGKFQMSNWLAAQNDISGFINYTYTAEKSDIYYDHELQQWREGSTSIGDIAPHKFNFGINLPFANQWNFHLGLNYVGSRQLYSRNPLREQDIKIDAYQVFNSSLKFKTKQYTIDFTIKNLLDESYYHPGGEQASSGNDFEERAAGFQNSLLVQTGRSFQLSYSYRFE